MPEYRRPKVKGATWFFTVTLTDRRSCLLVEEIDLLRRVFADVRRRRPFRVDAMVVLPDQIHAVWTLPDDDGDFSTRWSLIKGDFTRALTRQGRDVSTGRRLGERSLWQRRFWEHLIRDDGDFGRHVDYCHINPMKHGLVGRVMDWPYSTFHRAVREGDLSEDWAGVAEVTGRFGE